MRPGLIVLPFLAILAGAIGAAIPSTELPWANAAGWASAAAFMGLWATLEHEALKRAFTRKGAKYGASSGVIVILGILIIVGIASLTSRPRFNKSVDVTRNQLNTLSDQSIKIIEQTLEKDTQISIEAFFVEEEVKKTFTDLIALYEGVGAKFTVKVIDPRHDLIRAKALNLTDPNTVILTQGELEQRITTFNEEKFTNALVNVLKEKRKAIYFTTGHGEGQLRGSEATGFDLVAQALENNKYSVEELAILEEMKIPQDADLLVIGNPEYDFKTEEVRVVEDYLKRGGSLLVMARAMTNLSKLSAMVESFGIKINSDLVLLSSDDLRVLTHGQDTAFVAEFDDFHPVSRDFSRQSAVTVALKSARTLSEVVENKFEMKVTIVGKTTEANVRVNNVERPEDLANVGEDRIEMGPFPVVAVAAGKVKGLEQAANGHKESTDTKADASTDGQPQGEETRMVVVGSGDLATNLGAQAGENQDLFLNISSYLMQDEDFISIRPKDATKSKIDMASPSSQVMLRLLSFIFPFGVLVFGLMNWFSRRNA